jgi:3-oxoacyl-[acyl-carrier-protein] synthase II
MAQPTKVVGDSPVSQANAIWITGCGAATPLGNTYTRIADNLLNGRSGVRGVTSFDVSDHPSQIAGQVEGLPCPQGFQPDEFERLQRGDRLVLWCASAALRDAGCWEMRNKLRVGIICGLATEWLEVWEEDGLQGGNRVYDRCDNSQSRLERICDMLALSGPACSVSAACASGNLALAHARRWLELGWVDICVAGACDMSVTPMSLAGFGNLRALSRRNDHPESASRPFDRARDGFVLAEGGALFVLERADRARRRGARAYGEVAGYGASSDAYHMVIPSSDPKPAIAAIREALAEAQVDPSAVDYVNAHATSTPRGDSAEAEILRTVFGNAISRVPVSSTKSMTGHLLVAAAAVEALACLVAMDQQAIPPTINLSDPDCDLCHVANEARPQRLRIAISNSFGFGGSNTCLVLKAV